MGDGSFGPSSWLSSLTSPLWAEAHARRMAIVAALSTSSFAIGQPETMQHRGHPVSQAHCVHSVQGVREPRVGTVETRGGETGPALARCRTRRR